MAIEVRNKLVRVGLVLDRQCTVGDTKLAWMFTVLTSRKNEAKSADISTILSVCICAEDSDRHASDSSEDMHQVARTLQCKTASSQLS